MQKSTRVRAHHVSMEVLAWTARAAIYVSVLVAIQEDTVKQVNVVK